MKPKILRAVNTKKEFYSLMVARAEFLLKAFAEIEKIIGRYKFPTR